MGGAAEEQAVRHPVMLQRWATMTFLHWAYDPALVRPLVPGGLDLELFDGAAWVGLAAFEMARVRVPGLPPVPRLSRFPETNLRTYVRGPDGGGVWFLSLDAASLPVVLGGRAAYGVPTTTRTCRWRWPRTPCATAAGDGPVATATTSSWLPGSRTVMRG